ncbi:MFS transporter [Nitrospirillum viridazoti]|uniref:DHA2 family multidrug resistance protein n=2 Tax=Nitrospirillum TaxID=1543705 RepID=A0A560IUD4_9PROT|nr:MFS transporter [Nitrospirillum amazonense]TWB60594.1 DHA2 family multidrug resistance protein [Nitrospirillum amazonense]
MTAAAAPATPHPWPTLDGARAYIGILGVLLGALLSTLGSRVTTFGLTDLRGGLHAGFDEGAWITTAYGVGQMVVGVACPYLGIVFGARRVLFAGIGLFFMASLLAPLSPNLTAYLAMQFLSGLGAGTFIPLTIRFIVLNLPARLTLYGLAAYAMNSEFSQNIGAALEGWYAENWSIAWLNWQYCLVLPLMFLCVWIGVPREPLNTDLLKQHDWPGVAYAAVGFGLLYAGLDQGNRLDWTGNGLVVGLLVAGGLVTALFAIRELIISRRPFLNLRLMLRGNLFLLMLLLAGFRFIILSTAYIIPVYLQVVQNFRELQVGPVLLFIALPQFALILPLGWLLARVDGRWVLAIGALLIAIACLQATNLTSQWATLDFLPSQALQAVGQCLALTALVVLVVRNITPADAISIGALLQAARLFGGEIGVAFMQTFVRMREQLHSNLLGLHIDPLAGATADRLVRSQAVLSAHGVDPVSGATRLLANAVAQQASVLAYIDGFAAAAAGAFACIALAAWLRPPPAKA